MKKGGHLLEIGEVQSQVFFLINGVLRGFMVDENGRDITDCFACRYGDVVMGCAEIHAPSPINIEAITDCELIRIPMQLVEELAGQNPVLLLQLYNRFLTQAFVRHWQTKKALYHSAMQRYQWFLREYPGLIDTVCNKHIASFLGITPVTLSRLRAQLKREQAVRQDAEGVCAHNGYAI